MIFVAIFSTSIIFKRWHDTKQTTLSLHMCKTVFVVAEEKSDYSSKHFKIHQHS